MSNLLIDTPENLTLEADVAGFGSRFIAALLDYLIIFGILVALQILFRPSLRFDNDTVRLAVLFLAQYVVLTGYHLFFEYIMNGRTPGKRQLGLRVVQSNGLPLTASGLLIRNLLRLFDFFPFAYGVGMIAMFSTKNTQRLGDLAARTVVIYERRDLSVQSLRRSYIVNYEHISRLNDPPPYIHIERLTPNDHATIVNFLRRRDEIKLQRETLAINLADRMTERMEITNEVGSFINLPWKAEEFLEQIVHAFELKSSSGPSTQDSDSQPTS